MAAKLQDERSTSIYRAEQIQLLQEQVQELQARVPEVDMDDVVAAGNLAAVHHIFY
jgi:N-acetyl-anhydromuramyl-L-alanine amidase AmpD